MDKDLRHTCLTGGGLNPTLSFVPFFCEFEAVFKLCFRPLVLLETVIGTGPKGLFCVLEFVFVKNRDKFKYFSKKPRGLCDDFCRPKGKVRGQDFVLINCLGDLDDFFPGVTLSAIFGRDRFLKGMLRNISEDFGQVFHKKKAQILVSASDEGEKPFFEKFE